MWIRVTRFRFDPARYDEVLPLSRQIVSELQRMPGNQKAQVSIDRTGGTGNAVSTWDMREQANFARETVSPQIAELVGRMMDLGARFDPQEVGEVVT